MIFSLPSLLTCKSLNVRFLSTISQTCNELILSLGPEPKIIDMVDDDEDLPDDVPPERAKPKSPDVDHMEIVPEFEVETFIPAVPLTSPLQSILKRTEIQVSPPAAPKPAPIVRL